MTGLDLSRERVENLKDFLFEALIGDATDRATLVPLSLDKCEAVLISLGGSIVPSLLATLHAKEQGARRIIVKGLDSDHGLLLKQLDVERVIYPKIDAGNHLADQLTWPSILDSLPIDHDHAFVEVAVPESWCGQSLVQLDLRRQYGIWLIGVKDVQTNKLVMFPDSDVELRDDQILLVVGMQDKLTELTELL